MTQVYEKIREDVGVYMGMDVEIQKYPETALLLPLSIPDFEN